MKTLAASMILCARSSFFFQAEDGIRDYKVTGVQTCALPIFAYTVVGDAVNTESRLSDAASVGTVFAGRDTALATMAIASWRALPPLRLKGKREPVPAYELVGLRPPGAARLGLGDEAPFIGRDAEFGRLVGKLLDVVASRRPASIVVTGEAGVGKTRLGIELSRFAPELPGARGLWGGGTPDGQGPDPRPRAEGVRPRA